MDTGISRRAAARIAAGAFAAGLAGPVAATPRSVQVVQHARLTGGDAAAGRPAVYYDVLEPAGGVTRPPILMIHGGAHTGACFLATADGRPGWAQHFAARGHRVLVPDWPGVGRSGGVPLDRLDGALVQAGLADVLVAAGEPAIVLAHSMGGTFGWKLLEGHGARIRKLVAVAPAPPGNIQPAAAVVARGTGYIDVRQPAGVIRLLPDAPFFPPRAWAERKLIGTGAQFPADRREAYLASLQPIAPRLLLERTNVDGRQLRIADFAGFAGKPVLLVVGTDDFDHTEAADRPIVEWLNANGADAYFLALGERGISGNGHMMMLERNSDAVAALLAKWIDG
ncbi:alpha/beta fold hydrolase [uncultured Sphingomonas sp.]|uniref:alpha/beta fold hydrolase n=1 Tax=uncultured Sphingomonas sp. TaxID=158754 RepID=UPI0035CB5C21